MSPTVEQQIEIITKGKLQHGLTRQDVAKLLGISPQAVSQTEHRAIAKIRRKLLPVLREVNVNLADRFISVDPHDRYCKLK